MEQENVTITPSVIEKEEVAKLNFPNAEVLINNEDKKLRSNTLNRAIRLGNNQKRKVKIIFEDNNGVKQVETTVWAVTEKNILLKAGVSIPITRIHRVSPY